MIERTARLFSSIYDVDETLRNLAVRYIDRLARGVQLFITLSKINGNLWAICEGDKGNFARRHHRADDTDRI